MEESENPWASLLRESIGVARASGATGALMVWSDNAEKSCGAGGDDF